MNKPLAARLSEFKDGEWVVPYAILTFALLFGNLGWGKAVLFFMYMFLTAHIFLELPKVFKSDEVNKWRIYTVVALFLNFFVFLIMPVYALIVYTVMASQIKNVNKDEAMFKQRSLTYIIFCGLTALAAFFYSIKAMNTMTEIQRKIQLEKEADGEVVDDRLKIEKIPAQPGR